MDKNRPTGTTAPCRARRMIPDVLPVQSRPLCNAVHEPTSPVANAPSLTHRRLYLNTTAVSSCRTSGRTNVTRVPARTSIGTASTPDTRRWRLRTFWKGACCTCAASRAAVRETASRNGAYATSPTSRCAPATVGNDACSSNELSARGRSSATRNWWRRRAASATVTAAMPSAARAAERRTAGWHEEGELRGHRGYTVGE